jgi:nitroreductase
MPSVPGEPPLHLHPLLASRWSPLDFDVDHEVSAAQVDLLLEAARWAPSAGNSQPWAFIVGLRGDPIHQRLVAGVARSAARWAPNASALVANLAHRYVAGTDWEYSEFAQYDLGQAVAHLTLQARALGLFVRQFRAFDREGLAAEFEIPEHWEITTMAAIGAVPADAPGLAHPLSTSKIRRPLPDLRWPAPEG